MTDKVISTAIISQLWDKPDALQLLAYMIARADQNGDWGFQPVSVAMELGQSTKKVGHGLKLLEQMQIVRKIDYYYTYHINAISTNPTTTLLKDEYKDFAETFNRKVKDTAIPQIRGLSDTRKRALVSRAKEYGGLTALENILDKVVASDFLSGRKTDFCASFDWIFKKANFIKILEGNYDNKPIPSTTRNTPATRKEQRDRSLSLANEIVSNSDDLLSLYYGTGSDPHTR